MIRGVSLRNGPRQSNVTADLTRWILQDASPRLARITPDQDLIEILALLESGDLTQVPAQDRGSMRHQD